MSSQLAPKTGNLLLSTLPPGERDRLQPYLRPVMLSARTVVFERGEPLEHLHFVLSGYVSLLVSFRDSFQAETAGVGSEGVLGVSLALGSKTEAATAVVQVATTALRAPAFVVAGGEQFPTLRRQLLLYGEAMRAQSMQLAACNAHHSLLSRLARCLLAIQQRIGGEVVPMTHEALAALLCAHRPSVSVAIKQLERVGLLRVMTKSLVIVDRAGLAAAACECHGTSHDGTQHR